MISSAAADGEEKTLPNDNLDTTNTAETSLVLSTELLQKCRHLLEELDTFQSLLHKKLRNPQVVEARQLRSNVASELRALEKLNRQAEDAVKSASTSTSTTATTAAAGPAPDQDLAESRLIHALRSSNLPFYEAVWAVAKRSCTGLVAFGKRFYWDDEDGSGGVTDDGVKGKSKPSKDKRKSVFVDIIADDGEEWVKVSTISESRLLFEMAEKGWEMDDSDLSSGDEDGQERTILRNDWNSEEQDDENEIELIKLARDAKKAASATRVRYRHPRVRFVLPKIEEGKFGDIDSVLSEIRSHGITVECRESEKDTSTVPKLLVSKDEPALSHLLPHPFIRFTSTLNVDCTLLLALVSDLSHSQSISPLPTHHKAIVRQIEIEREQPLLPAELWPAMSGHDLVCTEEAAKRMCEIVSIIGTDTEKMRTRILMGDSPFESETREATLERFQELSDYQVPAQWRIPITVVDAKTIIDTARKHAKLPSVVQNAAEILSDINYSVFLYGWITGLTTITSNRTVAKQIEATVESHRNGDDSLEGPPVWVCDTARSLIGKEKDRK
ncbi:hypothetical protein MPDQ_003281 [Monascus purpureus]|uniref:DUF1308 domain-containing protein n=1 Tax=Monascus purpureus TaxID=5098 RepID=A0A507R3Y7_MONPU|nr:hypothetical protein MPDQ_003281 [Monascus purpureus]BDD55903.1 hypothetical protein MAP00_001385 [Monascus purpureus]